MKLEYVAYVAAARRISMGEVKRELPADVQEQLMQAPRLVNDVWVETAKTSVVEYLDTTLRIGRSRDFTKSLLVEVDRADMGLYAYYKIFPRSLALDRDVFATLIRPTCPHEERCPIGAGITSPVRMGRKKAHRIGIAAIDRSWQLSPELVLSTRAKDLFDAEGISGLEYERCVLDEDGSSAGQEGRPWVARIVGEAAVEYADDIIVKDHVCKKHGIIGNYSVFNPKTFQSSLSTRDFQLIDRIEVNGKTFAYDRVRQVVSRRVVELLIEHKIRGLGDVGFFFGEKFVPIVTVPEEAGR